MSPFPTPCKGKSKSQPFAHTFALTGRRRLYVDTQGVALGSELIALSGRSFSRFVRLSCAHASPLVVWLKTAQRFFWILSTQGIRGRLSPNKSSATAEDDQAKRAFFACSPLQKQVWAADEKILKPHQKYTRTHKHKKNGVLFGSPTSSR